MVRFVKGKLGRDRAHYDRPTALSGDLDSRIRGRWHLLSVAVGVSVSTGSARHRYLDADDDGYDICGCGLWREEQGGKQDGGKAHDALRLTVGGEVSARGVGSSLAGPHG